MSKYKDPPNVLEIAKQIREMPTLEDVKKLMDKTFPDLFIGSIKSYSQDYPTLNNNWKKIAKLAGSQPLEILIFDEHSENDTLVKCFAECLTSAGFMVRKKSQFFPCEKCGRALPSPQIWELLKLNNTPCPEKWSKTCSKC